MISSIWNYISLYGSVFLFFGIALSICNMRDHDRKYPQIMVIIGTILLIGPRILTMDTQLSTVQVKVIDQEKFTRGGLITVEYESQTYQLKGNDIYEKYKDKVGSYADGTLKTTVYIGGFESKEIIEIQ